LSLAAQQSSKELFGSALIAVRLNQDVDHVAVLIHGTPEILLLAVDSNEDLVQVPHIAEATLTPLQFSGIVGTEFLTPQPNRLIRDEDSSFGQKILDISEAQTETMVKPHAIADDLGRKFGSPVGDRTEEGRLHTGLPPPHAGAPQGATFGHSGERRDSNSCSSPVY
jgi:hypothetical protein